MALLFMDGFDGYSSASDLNLTYTGNSIGFTTTGGRFGGGALQTNTGGYGLIPPITPPADGWYSFAFYAGNAGSNGLLCEWSSASTKEARVEFNPGTGSIQFWRGNDNLLFGSGTLVAGWHWIDLHYFCDASGTAELWIDGVQAVNYSGQTYQSTATLTQFQFGDYGIQGPYNCFIDDVVINDTSGSINNGRVGDSRIETLRPTSDAGTNNGTPSTGSDHFAVVDDTTWDATDYLTITNTSGQEELFGVADLSSTPTTISAVQVTHYSQKTDAGSANLEAVLVSSGTESDGASIPVTPSWSRIAAIYETDPHTSAAWDGAGVNAVQVGVKVP